MWFTIGMGILFVLSLGMNFGYPQEKRKKGWHSINALIALLITLLFVVHLLTTEVGIVGILVAVVCAWATYASFKKASTFNDPPQE